VIISKQEFAQLKKEAEMGRSVGRFQVYTNGWRTWRLDTATGQNCLLLASEADWKKPKMQAQCCPD